MLNLQYLKEKTYYPIQFQYISENRIQIVGDFPIKTKGFTLSRIGNPNIIIGKYEDYTTVYKEIDGGVIFSNDGSEYVEPIPVVNFYTNGGGVLDGAVMQEVSTYEDLIVPTPIPNENYEFFGWSPEIPLSGKIESENLFTAIFKSTLPEPEPELTLEERVTVLEKDVQNINDTIVGGAKDE